MITRRTMIVAALLSSLTQIAFAQDVGDDGLHKQPWFHEGFLEMGPDLAEAAEAGKGLIVIFEQKGCPYCRELHEVNLVIPEIAEYQAENFLTVQINMWGSRIVTDFDGVEVGERELAQKWLINFTPTTLFFAKERVDAATFQEAESFRMPGYFKPFHYASALAFVASGAYSDEGFQRFTQARFDRLVEEGKDPSIWVD
ncbi:MAG: thioredoxin family protein [Paracoccaceae bacterium]